MPSGFVDANILGCAANNHPIDQKKRLRARTFLLSEDLHLVSDGPNQVLHHIDGDVRLCVW
jgi:hypothetical protein